ncbi:MAG: hypothetical protein QXQ14_01630 [Candidatus Aenigmatarchaeota archaeon]
MIKIESLEEIKVKEVEEKKERKEEISSVALERPYVVDAKVYKLKSNFARHSIFITIGYIKQDGKVRPFEIFINSKDLTRAAEFAALTRLLSAIFRRSEDPTFIIEELRSIYDPNGKAYLKNGRVITSLYGEIANVIEDFFIEMGIIKKEENKVFLNYKNEKVEEIDISHLQICPKCGTKTLKVESGCYYCINPSCGYTKCE